MGKLLVLIALLVIAVWLIKRAIRGSAEKEKGAPPVIEGDLVACAHCGVNLPRGEARGAGAEVYCSDEHARLGKR